MTTMQPSGPPMDSTLALSFKQARNYRPATGRTVTIVVMHSMEAVESTRTADNVAAWFAGPAAPMASAHYAVCCDSIVCCVHETDIAWHAPPVNSYSIGVEMAGFARASREDWEADQPMMFRAAELVADICQRHQLPVVFVDAAGLVAGQSGVTTHAQVSLAFKKTDHVDPGGGWPMEHFLELVQDCLDGKAIRESLSDLADGTADTDPAPG